MRVPTVASPMSTLERPVRKSVALLEEKRTPAVVERPAQTLGRPTCAVRPVRSIGVLSCHLLKGFALTCERRRRQGKGLVETFLIATVTFAVLMVVAYLRLPDVQRGVQTVVGQVAGAVLPD